MSHLFSSKFAMIADHIFIAWRCRPKSAGSRLGEVVAPWPSVYRINLRLSRASMADPAFMNEDAAALRGLQSRHGAPDLGRNVGPTAGAALQFWPSSRLSGRKGAPFLRTFQRPVRRRPRLLRLLTLRAPDSPRRRKEMRTVRIIPASLPALSRASMRVVAFLCGLSVL